VTAPPSIPRVDAMALHAAEVVEKSAGPRAGFALFKTLALTLAHDGARARAILGALRCAIGSGDDRAIDGVVAWWRSIGDGFYADDVLELSRSLVASRRAAAAAFLVEAEVARQPRARSLYLLARCFEMVGDDGRSLAAFGQAAERADKEGETDIARAARIARASRLAERAETLGAALAEVATVDAAACSLGEKLALSAIRLRAPSRFARASALSTLDDVARSGDAWLAERAVLAAARHADAMGAALTPLEADRLGVVLAAWPDERERDAALLRLRAIVQAGAAGPGARDDAWIEAAEGAPETAAHARRVRAMMAGAPAVSPAGSQAPRNANGDAGHSDPIDIAGIALDAVAALRARDDATAVRCLEDMARLSGGAGREHTPLPAPAWTAVHVGIGSSSRAARTAAITAAAALLATPPSARGALEDGRPDVAPCYVHGAPPRGFVAIAAALAAAGATDLERRALYEADARAEPGAKDALIRALVRHAWDRAANDDRAAALAALREARDLAVRG